MPENGGFDTTTGRLYDGDVPLCRDPVFVVGAPRSGTTALARALAAHTGFWASEETYILYSLFGDGRVEREFDRWLHRPSPSWFRRQEVGRAEFMAHLGLGLNALFSSRSGGKRWIDHTPHYVFMVETLAALFPGAFFVHIVRDGRAVVHSMLRVENTLSGEMRERMSATKFLPTWTHSFRDACKMWRESVAAAAAAEERCPDRFLSIRHEELGGDAPRAFRTVLEFLGARVEQGPARYWSSTRINSSFGRAAGDEAALRRASAEERWRTWSPDERRLFVDQAGDELVRLGYASADELEREAEREQDAVSRAGTATAGPSASS